MILVVGGTGTTGRELVKELARAKAPFRLMVRNSKAVKGLQAQGIESVPGDLERPKTLAAALKDVEKVFLLSTNSPDAPKQHGHFVDAAKKAGVKHLVRFSALGASPTSKVSFFRWHGEADERVKASGVPWTLLRPHYFMQNFVTFSKKSIVEQDAIYLPLGTTRVGMVDVRDLAICAARTLTTDGHEGKAYDLTGPEVISMAEVAQKLTTALGRKITYVDVTPEAARAGLSHAGAPRWLVDGVTEMYEAFRAGQGPVLTSDALDLLGKMPRTFDRFALDHRTVLSKA